MSNLFLMQKKKANIFLFILCVYRETDDSSQIFVPFINDVRVGCPESNTSASVDFEEGYNVQSQSIISGIAGTGSPPSMTPASNLPQGTGGRLTPPSSPNVGQPHRDTAWEPVDLQLDYWGKAAAVGEKGKSSLRQAFKVLHVQRLPAFGEPPGQYFFMSYMSKDSKKQKSEFVELFELIL